MATPNLLERVLTWLRAGYPQGVPQQDYVALFGILHRSLTEQEIETVARAVEAEGAGDDAAIKAQIERLVLEHASEDDVRRVTERLIAGGWPSEVGPDGVERLKDDVTV